VSDEEEGETMASACLWTTADEIAFACSLGTHCATPHSPASYYPAATPLADRIALMEDYLARIPQRGRWGAVNTDELEAAVRQAIGELRSARRAEGAGPRA
jgi:hypothetical protein